MKPVTDPALLSELEGKQVTDPALLAQLEGTQPEPGFGENLDNELGSIPRQLGLTARAVPQAMFDAMGIFSDPVAAIGNMLGGNFSSASALGEQLIDKTGLPSPETPRERIAQSGAKTMIALGMQTGLAQKAALGAKTVTKGVMESLAANPAAQISGAAGGGTAGAHAKETGGGPVAQFVAALGGGFSGAGAAQLAEKSVPALNAMVQSLKGQRVTTVDLTRKVNQVLADSGMKVSDIPSSVRMDLLKELENAVKVGRPVNPAVMRRLMDYGRTGAKPTKGTLTLDPAQLTREKNIAKVGANSTDPKLQQMARMQRENEMKLVKGLNDIGGQADDAVGAGARLQTALRAVDKPRKDQVDAAYAAVRASDGRYANLDVPTFSRMANDALDEKALGTVLPDSAKALLNDVSSGKIPLNVNTVMLLDKRLSGLKSDMLSGANKNREGALAIQTVRDALFKTPVESGIGDDAIQAYEAARGMAAQRFAWIDKNPAMKAALEGEAPDKFVQTYLTSNTKKSTVQSVKALANDLMDDPEAFDAARSQIIAHLKSKALPSGIEEAANFSPSGYNRAINAIGDKKLASFFSADEIQDLRAIGRVAQYEKFQPTGSAVNNSNTASAVAGLLEKIAGNRLLSHIPIAGQGIEDSAQNWAMQIQSKDAMNPLGALLNQAEQVKQPFPVAPLALPAALATED